jgi:hypothetical protein
VLGSGEVVVSLAAEGCEREGWPARGPCGRHLGGQVQMVQDPPDHRRLFGQRDEPETPATPRAGQHVEPKAPVHHAKWLDSIEGAPRIEAVIRAFRARGGIIETEERQRLDIVR